MWPSATWNTSAATNKEKNCSNYWGIGAVDSTGDLRSSHMISLVHQLAITWEHCHTTQTLKCHGYTLSCHTATSDPMNMGGRSHVSHTTELSKYTYITLETMQMDCSTQNSHSNRLFNTEFKFKGTVEHQIHSKTVITVYTYTSQAYHIPLMDLLLRESVGALDICTDTTMFQASNGLYQLCNSLY